MITRKGTAASASRGSALYASRKISDKSCKTQNVSFSISFCRALPAIQDAASRATARECVSKRRGSIGGLQEIQRTGVRGMLISFEDEASLVRRFAAGETDLIGPLTAPLQNCIVRDARRLLRSNRSGPSLETEQGIVDLALFHLCAAATAHKLDGVGTLEDIRKALRSVLMHVIQHVRDHDAARKRGGPGRYRRVRSAQIARRRAETAGPIWESPRPPSVRRDIDLDLLVARWPGPFEEVQARLDMEALASRLVKPQERTVLKMRLENGLSAEEIARVLGKSVSWVKVQLRSIRRAWNAMNRDG
jgi:hypothetical protein